ncbi:fungal-specific transcription factor domain-containing protein [Aspergillus pseudodeflectus]|uniref:Fungal-specific transcription factor domain-containing protein n=1 Tax=Aspergillus pseudodeflectus TaxID=176178 RepID=A0ABR4JG81_9EURO
MATPTFIVDIPSAGPSSNPKKRSQVARACNRCRVHRLKCDSEYPCANCRKRGGQCNHDRLTRSVTLPQAYREIERLKARVSELELELQNERQRPSGRQLQTPATPEDELEGNAPKTEKQSQDKFWEGIHISTARSPNKTWYGASSLFFFIGSINKFLATALKENHSARGMMPESASTVLDGPAEDLHSEQSSQAAPIADSIRPAESLSSIQEEYFINLFWESYYPSFPILDEAEFKEHYQSLWTAGATERKPSALVDMVLALCMQYGMARQPGRRQALTTANKGNVDDSDSTIAGRWHYRRCLALLSSQLESPTLSTLQCHILCSIYLCNAGFQNMTDNSCGLAVRTAFMLGLHLEPPQNMPQRERELRKRIWWILYILESNRSMKMGRPFILQDSSYYCSLPSGDREIARTSGSSFAPIGENITWLTWSLYKTKLVIAVRKAYMSVYAKPPVAVVIGNTGAIAAIMDGWLKGVPEALKIARQNGGVPFSTDLSPVQIEQFTPGWLQRERLLLELTYHCMSTNLYRSAICFTLNGAPPSATEQAASKCAAHAIALTHITYQVLNMSSILHGWHEAFQWQWNVSMTLVGYVLAFPQTSSSAAAREAIDLSVSVFEHFGNSFAVATNAATIMRDLSRKVDRLRNNWMTGTASIRNTLSEPASTGPGQPCDNSQFQILPNSQTNTQEIDWLSHLGMGSATAEIGGILGHSIDVSAEMYADLDWSDVNGTFFDQWAL